MVGPTVEVESGRLEGVAGDGWVKFLGVPYAAAPVGPLRWRAPQPPPAWSGVRAADRFGPSCIQPPLPKAIAATRDFGPQSEDCLYLNVWAPPGAAGRKLPVMMWIHGGSYIIGSGSWPTYDGAAFARQDVVLVTINYRLNYFGFFAHPALTAENADDGLLGNYGVLDQIAALRWIQRNIEAFGGDPGNVTVFGESAGGTFTNLLMISPAAEGLFHRAVVQSAPAFQPWRRMDGTGVSRPEQLGQRHAERLGLGAGADLDALRAVPAERLMGDVDRVWSANIGPIVDGIVVPDWEAEAYAAGRQHKVPLIVGATSFEASLMAAYPVEPETLIEAVGAGRATTLSIYDPDGGRAIEDVAKDIYGDRMFVAPARYLATQAGRTQPAWMYHFAYVPEALRGRVYGAAHGSELPFVFRTSGAAAMESYEDTAADLAMAKTINAYWVNFARHGDPNGPGLPAWPPCRPGAEMAMEFADDGPRPRERLLQARLDLVEPAARARPRPAEPAPATPQIV